MAKSNPSRRLFKREKKTRVSKTEEYLVNTRYLGAEPKYTGEVLTDLQLTTAYTWYSYMCRASDAREYIVEYMDKIGKKNVARLMRSVADGQVPLTAGWICRILTRGGKITDRTKEFLLDRVTRSIERSQTAAEEEARTPSRPSRDVQASIRDKARDIIGDLESMIDNAQPFNIYDYMQKKNIPAIYAAYIADYYQKMAMELEEVLAGTDPDLNFAYRKYSKTRIEKSLAFYKGIVDGADKFSENAKRVRKANRKPRTVSVEKQIKNLKYQKNDQEYKLVSVEPQQILAAQELWTFNTKTRMLSVYRAQDAGGLGIKTVSVTGFNEGASMSKRLRKPSDFLQKVLTGGKVVLREIMDSITTVSVPVRGRLTPETILLRVVK
jgi:hypothetical protein